MPPRRWILAVALLAGAALHANAVPDPAPTYEVDPTWPKLPNNWVIGDPSSIAVDRHDHVWILHRPRTVPADRKDRAAPPVLEFDRNGRFVREGRFVTEGFVNRTAKGGNTVCGLALSQDKGQTYLFVSDFGNQLIVVLDRRTLKVLTQFGGPGKEPGNFQNAHHIALDSKNNLYTAEVSPGSGVQRFRFKGLAPVPAQP